MDDEVQYESQPAVSTIDVYGQQFARWPIPTETAKRMTEAALDDLLYSIATAIDGKAAPRELVLPVVKEARAEYCDPDGYVKIGLRRKVRDLALRRFYRSRPKYILLKAHAALDSRELCVKILEYIQGLVSKYDDATRTAFEQRKANLGNHLMVLRTMIDRCKAVLEEECDTADGMYAYFIFYTGLSNKEANLADYFSALIGQTFVHRVMDGYVAPSTEPEVEEVEAVVVEA